MFTYPHLNTRGVGRILDSYANPRHSQELALKLLFGYCDLTCFFLLCLVAQAKCLLLVIQNNNIIILLDFYG